MIRLHHVLDSALHLSSRVHFDSISITIPRNPEETLIAGKVMGVGSKQKPPTEMLQRFHRLPSREVTYPLPAGTFKPMIFRTSCLIGICLVSYPGVVSFKESCNLCLLLVFQGSRMYIFQSAAWYKKHRSKSWWLAVCWPDGDGPDGGWMRKRSPRFNEETSHIHTGQLRHFRVWWRLWRRRLDVWDGWRLTGFPFWGWEVRSLKQTVRTFKWARS